MKTTKHFTVMAIVAIVTLAFAHCKNDPKQTQCECADPEHLGVGENCECGKDSCNCTLQVYGSFDDIGGHTIKIYRKGDVNDMAAAVAKVKEAYEGLIPYGQSRLDGKIKDIRIVPGSDGSWSEDDNGMYTIELGEERSRASMRAYMQNSVGIVQPPSPLSQSPHRCLTPFWHKFI